MAQIITNIVQGVGGGIGFVSEAYKAHKATKVHKQTDSNAHQSGPSIPEPHHAEGETRELDETHSDPNASSETTETEATDPLTLASAFLSRLPPSTPSSFQPLPYPIIIPQRRPSDRSRGFLPSYAPILSTRSITESDFLDFLSTFNKSTQATKWIAALNLASLATVCLPTLTSVLVSMAITAATTAAMEVQGRVKTNCFLDKVNEQFFMPRGLFCLVVTWNPEAEDARQAVDFEAMAKRAMGSSGKRNPMSKLKSSSGSTHGEFEWPEIAPLIYPSSDLSSNSSTSEEATQATKSLLQKKRVFIDDYMDRRAQAKFAMQNPESALAAGPKAAFTSRFADPSHAANSGSPIALLSGGAIQMPERQSILDNRGARGQDGRMGGRAALGRGFGGATEREGAREVRSEMQRRLGGLGGGRGGSNAGPLGLVQKVMKKDVLYLLIVDMPSDDELAAAQGVATELLAGGRLK